MFQSITLINIIPIYRLSCSLCLTYIIVYFPHDIFLKTKNFLPICITNYLSSLKITQLILNFYQTLKLSILKSVFLRNLINFICFCLFAILLVFQKNPFYNFLFYLETKQSSNYTYYKQRRKKN